MPELEGFRVELAKAGLEFPGPIIVDGKIHRFKGGDDKEPDSWLVLHLIKDDLVVGAYGSWRKNFTNKWCSRDKSKMSRDDWSTAAKAWKELEKQRADEEQRKHEEVRKKCSQWFASFPKAEGHLYLATKGVQSHGQLTVSNYVLYPEWLALPLQDINGTVWNAQFIADDGTKRFTYGGRVSGLFFQLSDVPGGPILIAEGYATAASVYEATGWTTVAALNCGNLLPVAQAFRQKYPNRTIVICADNDQWTDGNPGMTKAEAACKAARCLLANPEFSDESLETKPVDFNDLHQLAGLAEVAAQVYSAFPFIGRPIGSLLLPPKDDPTELLKSRFLCAKGGMLLNGPTGAGKSSISIQQAACWTNGLPFFGIRPTKPFRIVIIQAEDDDGDIAEMRNGVCAGLSLTEEQRKIFFENCLIYTASNGITGEAFCKEVVRPLLDLHMPHFLMINPILSFIGGNVKEQEVVGSFLRAYLNPVIFEYNVGCEVFHHTNKPPTGKEKATWGAGDMAYLGSGSSEWANWARAILSLQSYGKPGYFKLHAAKRGTRLGWTDENDELIYQRPIAWSREKGSIYWRTPTEEELAELESGPTPEERAKKVPQKFVDVIAKQNLTMAEWVRAATNKLGIPRRTAYRYIEVLKEAGRVFLRPGTEVYVLARKP